MKGIDIVPFTRTGKKLENIVDELKLVGVPDSLLRCSQCGHQDYLTCQCQPIVYELPKKKSWFKKAI